MFSLPTKYYALDNQKINRSLQFLYEALVTDLNKLATDGLEHPDFGAPGLPWHIVFLVKYCLKSGSTLYIEVLVL